LGRIARLALAAALLAAVGTATQAGLPPDEVFLPAMNGGVLFTHRNHFTRYVDGCRSCHAQQTGGDRLSRNLPHVYGKEAAHAFCVGCHERREEGPTRCSQCHDPNLGRSPALQPPPPPAQDARPEPWPPQLRAVRPDRIPPEYLAALERPAGQGAEAVGGTGKATRTETATEPPTSTATRTATETPTRTSPATSPPTSTATSSPSPTAAPAASPPPSPPPAPAAAPPPAPAPRPAEAFGRVPTTPGEMEMQLIREIEEADARDRAARAKKADGG
jgi:hypothetical protein